MSRSTIEGLLALAPAGQEFVNEEEGSGLPNETHKHTTTNILTQELNLAMLSSDDM